MASSEIETIDIVVIFVYLGIIFVVGMATTCRPNRGTSSGYFLAGRNMMWFLVGASLFASNIGSYHFVGLAGSGAAAGWGAGAYEFNVDLYSGAVFVQETLKWNIVASITFLLILTAIYTVLGGLAAVIWTDTANFIVMMLGGIILMIIAFIEVGGMQGVLEDYPCAVPNETLYRNDTCGIPRDDSFRMFRHPVGSDMPFPGFVLGQSPASIWYWCADQVIVQRALAAKNLSHAKGGTLLAGYFKILPTFMMVIPGMIARILWPDEIACVSGSVCERVCNNPSGCTDIAYPRLVMELLPTGLRGLMIAVMLAALMSSLTSIFNSGATIFVVDLWKMWRKKAGEKESMIVGRLFVLVLVVISVLWLPVVANSQGGQLWHYIQEVTGYLSPPIAAVFLLAILWHGINEPGTFWSLMIALLFGCARFIFMVIWPAPNCGEEDTRPYFVRIHYFYIATMLFWGTIVICWIISKCTKQRIPENMLYRLTYWTRHKTEERVDISELYNPLWISSHMSDAWKDSDVVNNVSFCPDIQLENLYNDENHMVESEPGQHFDNTTSVVSPNSKDTAQSGLCEITTITTNHAAEITKFSTGTGDQREVEIQCDIPEDFDVDQMEGVTKYGSRETRGERQRKSPGVHVLDATWKYCCGISSETERHLSEKELDALKATETNARSIHQTDRDKLILNINLVIILVVGGILYALFGFIIDRAWKANGEIECPQYYQ
ncbi:sodium/glucose cotransporter 4-like isoform X2 [Ptychodera flava]|uniref:sodium/glucose cotransporter 4-like isoform X2 n=1 Tax=Ptychodera flava TaxID=63121 RepID=UPI00396A646B